MKFISYQIIRSGPAQWQAVNSRFGRLGGVTFKRKCDLVEAVESRFNGDIMASVALIPAKQIGVKS